MILPGTTDLAELAGHLNDYSEPVDPTTDLPAEASNKTRANVAAMTRLTPRIYLQWSNDGTNGTVVFFDSVVGNDATNWPTFLKTAPGAWRLTFPASAIDLLNQSQDWNFRYGEGDLVASTPGKVQVVRFAPNIVDVYLWALTVAPAAADDLAGETIAVRIF